MIIGFENMDEDYIEDDAMMRRIGKKIDKERIRTKDTDLRKLVESVFDHSTYVRLLHHINKKRLKTVEFVLSTGKEANVYYSTGWEGEEFALKIFRIEASEFKKRMPYIRGDRRFKSIRKSTRGFIYEWASKEFKNLSRMRNAGVIVPEPYWIDRNLLLMEFIGEGGYPAPLLKDAAIEDHDDTYSRLISLFRKIVKDAGLVHADLSEYNVIYYKNEPWIIDVSQAVLLSHPGAREFLIRDILNITRFFTGTVSDLFDPTDLFVELMSTPNELEKLKLEGADI